MNHQVTTAPRDGSVEAGLICLAAASRPGQRWTHRDIAKVCGCSRTLIFLVEKKALKKIRESLRRQVNMTHGEFYGRNNALI